ncbi:PREDICTED: uncharacterized protein LOC109147766 [Ipomoea nil]|uniref:uncharacterized protein LOC109147766 n=1 Tax=Ipomoea nil TaxID=35883 RepID=UPI000900A0A1|nr:PREDICTED: uncharacterized protein LOC109147766 [Ipomoea nil]
MQPNIPLLAMSFNHAEFWVQLHDLPYGFYSEKTAKAIGNHIGTYVRIDENTFEGWWKSFIRIRVSVDITKPLLCKMRIRKTGEEWSWISFQYECLPNFCFLYGILGHTEKFCSKPFDEVWQGGEKLYGAWMRVASRRAPPAAGQRWLVLDHGRGTGSLLVQSGGIGTNSAVLGLVPGTSHIWTNPQSTEVGREEHVSTENMDVGEMVGDVDELPRAMEAEKDVGDGLTLLDQKRRRVDAEDPLAQSSLMHFDLNETGSLSKNGPMAGPVDQARPQQ